jgi:hypothetical protein
MVWGWWIGVAVTGLPLRLTKAYKPQALCAPPLVLPVIPRGAPVQATWEISVSEGRNYGREMAGQFGLRFRLPRKSQGSFTCHKSATWDRRIYFPSEGRHVVEFFARKIRRLRPGSNPRSCVPEASMLTTKRPKPPNGVGKCAAGHTVLQGGTYLANEGGGTVTAGFRVHVCENVV